jgi:hypothetical protein
MAEHFRVETKLRIERRAVPIRNVRLVILNGGEAGARDLTWADGFGVADGNLRRAHAA